MENLSHSYPQLCGVIEKIAEKRSVVDLGAGLGWYGMCMLRKRTAPFVVSPDVKADYMKNFFSKMKGKIKTPQLIHSYNGKVIKGL